MQFIVVIQPRAQLQARGLPADFADVEDAEQARAQSLYKCDVARQLWAIKTDRKGAIGLFEAASEGELQEVINSFPMVQKDYVEYQVFPVGAFAGFTA